MFESLSACFSLHGGFHIIKGTSMMVSRPCVTLALEQTETKMLESFSTFHHPPSFLPSPPSLQIDVNGRTPLSLSLSPPLSIPGIMVIARRNERVVRNRRPSVMARQPANVESSTNLAIPRDHPANHRSPLDPFSPFSHFSTIDLFFFTFLFFRSREHRVSREERSRSS